MAGYAENEPYQGHCPLCESEIQVAPREEDMCAVCGAELTVFDDETEANQYAERMKARGETASWRQVLNGPFFVVGHKATPMDMAA